MESLRSSVVQQAQYVYSMLAEEYDLNILPLINNGIVAKQ